MSHTRRSPQSRPSLLFILWALALLTASCRSPQIGEDISVTIQADGSSSEVQVTSGSTVTQALASVGITPGSLDRSEPPFYTVLSNGDVITLTRVEEVFETQQVVIPFERQLVRNETLPEGETRLVQAGING